MTSHITQVPKPKLVLFNPFQGLHAPPWWVYLIVAGIVLLIGAIWYIWFAYHFIWYEYDK